MMYNIAEELTFLNKNVELVLANRKGEYLEQVNSNIVITDFGTSNPTAVFFSLVNYIYKKRPSVIVSAMTNPNCLCILSSVLFPKTKVIISERTALSIQSKELKRYTEKIKPFLAKLLYRFADEYIAISKGVAEDISSLSGIDLKKITVIYNPVINSRVKELISCSKKNRKKTNLLRPTIVAMGRFVPAKDFQTLLYALKELTKGFDVELILIGKGPLEDRLKKLTAELSLTNQVKFVGFDINPYKYLVNASVFALSSRWEGFGNVIVEAMACGVPVVATDCKSGPSEILENGKYGSLVPVGDSLAMAKAIKLMIENPVDPSVLQARAFEFSSDKIAMEYLHLINKTIGSDV